MRTAPDFQRGRELHSPAPVWFACFALSHVFWLAQTSAGNLIGYDHWGVAEGRVRLVDVVGLAFYAGQSVAVARALRATGLVARIHEWLRSNVAPVFLGAAALLWLGSSSFPHAEPAVFATEWPATVLYRVLQLATLALAVDALPAGGRAIRLLDSNARWLGIDRVALSAAIFVFATSASLMAFGYQAHPHIPDEVGYLWHARYFAEGRLAAPAPPVPEAFPGYLVDDCNATRCVSPVPPGWPAVLALGVAIGIPWLVNPLLAASAVLLVFRLVSESFDARTARVACLLLAASPWFLLTSMSLMTHDASLVAALIAAIGGVRLSRGGSLAWAVASGTALGFVSLVRPLEGVIASLAIAAIAITRRGAWVERIAAVSLTALVAGAVGALQLVYNFALTGSAVTFPINAYADRVLGPGVNALGFGPERGVSWGGLDPFPGHGLRDVALNSMLNATAINLELFGWAIGSLAPAVLFVALRRCDARDALAIATVAIVVIAHAFYWFSGGPDFGARYWFLALPPLVLLSARGLLALDASVGGGRVLLATLIVSVVTLVTHLPWRALDKYRDYRGMRPDIRAMREELAGENMLVLVRGKAWPDFASAHPYNPIDLRADGPIFTWDRDDATRARLLAAYPDRRVLVVDGPTLTSGGFLRVEGPLKPGAPLETPPTPPEIIQ